MINLDIHPNKAGDDAFHPSGDCYPCALEIYLKKIGVMESKITGSTHKTFMVGHFWHGLLQAALIDMGFTEEQYIEARVSHFTDKWWGTGSADVLRCEIPGVGPVLVDFKTMNDYSFNQISLDPSLLEKWTLQTNCYMQWSGHDDIERAIIVGVQKGTPHNFKEFVIPRNETVLEDVYKKWDLVSDAISSKTIPHCDCDDEKFCAARKFTD